jgi:hypothetical protein
MRVAGFANANSWQGRLHDAHDRSLAHGRGRSITVNAISCADGIKWRGRSEMHLNLTKDRRPKLDGNGCWTRAHARVLGSETPAECFLDSGLA